MIALWLSVAWGAAHEVASAPSDVVVFADRARVTRTVSVTLPAGSQEIVLSGLPATTSPDSVTADARGGGVLRGVDVRAVTAREAADRRVKEIEARIATLDTERQAFDDRVTAASTELKTLDRARQQSAKALSQQLLVGEDAAGMARGLRGALATQEDRARAELRDASRARQAVLDDIAALQRERANLGSSGSSSYTAVVHVDLDRAATLSVDVSYIVGNARWQPHYDVRADAAAKDVELALSAMVVQATGEDWEGVRLTVSSARPSDGTDVPVLQPFWLQAYRPPPPPPRPAPSRAASAAPAAKAEMAYDDAGPPPMEAMEVVQAVVDVQLAATTFKVPRAEDVPSDGTERKVLLTTEKLSADLRYVVVPRVDPRAYLVGEVTNTAVFPLLAGEAGVFLAGAYLGDTALETVPPGEKFDLAFGVDDRVTVRRAPAGVEIGGSGPPGKRLRSKWVWQITLKNAHKRPIAVEVREQLPVSTHADVVVKRLPEGPTPREEDGGILVFPVELPAGAERSFTWGYTVEYPSDQVPGWME